MRGGCKGLCEGMAKEVACVKLYLWQRGCEGGTNEVQSWCKGGEKVKANVKVNVNS